MYWLRKIMKKRRVTVLAGAGACLEIGGPSTKTLTDAIKSITIDCIPPGNDYILKIADELDSYYGQNNWNFEDLFHLLEISDSYLRGWNKGTVKRYKPILGAFVQPTGHEIFQSGPLIQAKRKSIQLLAELINSYDIAFDPSRQHSWFYKFWRGFERRSHLDIFTLNYDTCIEKSLTSINDGFRPTGEGYYKFHPKELYSSNNSRVIHLHGCIRYGHLPNKENLNEHAFTEDFHDLYKYNSYREAEISWFNRSDFSAQSGDEAVIGPIITGLRKTDKILVYPYSEYYSLFNKCILENERLLVIGYSYGDNHFNQILNRITSIHGENRRVVLITYCAPTKWCQDPACMDEFNHGSMEFLEKACKEFRPFDKYLSYPEKIISKDGKSRIYLLGFKETVRTYGDEIIEFLND